jgi:hypothetical protein
MSDGCKVPGCGGTMSGSPDWCPRHDHEWESSPEQKRSVDCLRTAKADFATRLHDELANNTDINGVEPKAKA